MCLHYDPETFSLLILISLTFWGKIWGSSLRSKLQAQTLDKLLKNCTSRGLVHKFIIPQTFTYHGTFSPCFMFLAHQYNEGDFLQRELYMEGPPTAFERPKKTQSKWYADSSPSGQFPDRHFLEDRSPACTSPTDAFPIDISPNGQFPNRTLSR